MRCTECDYVRRPGEFGPGRDIGRCPECGAYYHQQKRVSAVVKPKSKAKGWIILAGFLAVLGWLTYLLLPKAAPMAVKPEPVAEPVRSANHLAVPSDPKGNYTVLGVYKVDYSHVQIDTLREGSSGRTYSRRLVDCGQAEIMYLGTGETIREMERERPDPGMSPIVDGSIAFYIAQRACRDSPLRKYTLD